MNLIPILIVCTLPLCSFSAQVEEEKIKWDTTKADLSAYASIDSPVAVYYCDSVRITTRPIPPHKAARLVLAAKLEECKTDRDSLDAYTAFVYRVFDFGGTQNADYPDWNLWQSLTFEQMYKYGEGDSDGIYCGQRCRALQCLLKEEGFTDVIEYSLTGFHNFLLVRTRDNELWICDPYFLWGIVAKEKRLGFISYLMAAKANPLSVKVIDLTRTFGEPDKLLPVRYFEAIKNCSNQPWLPRDIFLAESPIFFQIKTTNYKPYSDWVERKLADYTAENVCLAPDSVFQLKCSYPQWTDNWWGEDMIRQILAIRN